MIREKKADLEKKSTNVAAVIIEEMKLRLFSSISMPGIVS